MIENYPYSSKPTPRGALQIELQARETEKQLAILAATYKAEGTASKPARSASPLKNLLATLFAGVKPQSREYVGAAQITLANQARK